MLKDVRKIKDKKSLNAVRILAQIMAYKINLYSFSYFFINLRLDSLRLRTIFKNFYEGFILNYKIVISRIIIKRPIIRNGVKLKKLPRK